MSSGTAEKNSHRYSFSAWSYGLATLLLVAGMAIVLLWRREPIYDPGAVVVFVILAVLSEHYGPKTTRDASISLNGLLMVVAIGVSGPIAAILVGLVPGMIIGPMRARAAGHVLARIFNPAMSALAGGTGALTYLWFDGDLPVRQQSHAGHLLLHVLMPLVVANVVTMLTNFVVLAGMIRITSREPVGYTFWRMVPATAVVYGEYGLLAFWVVVLWGPVGLGLTALGLAAIPLIAAQWDMSQIAYARISQSRTMSTLRELVEVRRPGRWERSRKVADTAISMATAMHVPAAAMEDLEHAALLADLEDVAVPTLTPQDQSDASTNITAGIEPVQFLNGARKALVMQHERWDGSGPRGVTGDGIPIVTRVVTVASAYWATRSKKDDPDQAMAAVEFMAGTRFDPDCVTALRVLHDRERSRAGHDGHKAVETS